MQQAVTAWTGTPYTDGDDAAIRLYLERGASTRWEMCRERCVCLGRPWYEIARRIRQKGNVC